MGSWWWWLAPLALLMLLQEKQREAYQQQLLELEHKQQHFSLDNRFQDSYANPAAPKMGDDKGRPPPTPCGLSPACLSPCTCALCYSSEACTWVWSPCLTHSCAGLPCVCFFCCSVAETRKRNSGFWFCFLPVVVFIVFLMCNCKASFHTVQVHLCLLSALL